MTEHLNCHKQATPRVTQASEHIYSSFLLLSAHIRKAGPAWIFCLFIFTYTHIWYASWFISGKLFGDFSFKNTSGLFVNMFSPISLSEQAANG